ncbi:MAG: DUF456 domain-containing protein [Planctomycetota bacterium]
MIWVWLALAWLIVLLAAVGSIVPILPGPPIAYGAFLLMDWATGWSYTAWDHALALTAIVVSTVLDYIVPAMGAKKFGADKLGIQMSVVGMILGLFFFPPFGLFLGAAVGAVAGELMAGKRDRAAFRAAFGVLAGTVAGTMLKLLVVIGIGVWITIQM